MRKFKAIGGREELKFLWFSDIQTPNEHVQNECKAENKLHECINFCVQLKMYNVYKLSVTSKYGMRQGKKY